MSVNFVLYNVGILDAKNSFVDLNSSNMKKHVSQELLSVTCANNPLDMIQIIIA